MFVHPASISFICLLRGSATASPSFFSHSSPPKTSVCKKMINIGGLYEHVKRNRLTFNYKVFFLVYRPHASQWISALPDADKTPKMCLDLGLQLPEIIQSVMSRQLALNRVFSIPRRPPVWLCLSSRLRYSLWGMATALWSSRLVRIITVNRKQNQSDRIIWCNCSYRSSQFISFHHFRVTYSAARSLKSQL